MWELQLWTCSDKQVVKNVYNVKASSVVRGGDLRGLEENQGPESSKGVVGLPQLRRRDPCAEKERSQRKFKLRHVCGKLELSVLADGAHNRDISEKKGYQSAHQSRGPICKKMTAMIELK